MQIILRTPDILRRKVSRFDRYTPEWGHSKRLDALAAMMGYAAWADLVQACRPDAKLFLFDHELPSPAARESRWLAQARGVTAVCGLLLPNALDLVLSVRPTQKIGGPAIPSTLTTDAFDMAFLEDQDVWWVGGTHFAHLAAPIGFQLRRAVPLAKLAAWRLGRRERAGMAWSSASDAAPEGDWVLSTNVPPDGTRFPIPYSREVDLLKLDPEMPIADPGHYEIRLRELAGLSPKTRKREIQITIRARNEAGHAWHWPLRFANPDSPAVAKAHDWACEVDGMIAIEYGTRARYIDVSR